MTNPQRQKCTLTVEVVKWKSTGLWNWYATLCGAHLEGETPRESEELSWLDASRFVNSVDGRGVKLEKR